MLCSQSIKGLLSIFTSSSLSLEVSFLRWMSFAFSSLYPSATTLWYHHWSGNCTGSNGDFLKRDRTERRRKESLNTQMAELQGLTGGSMTKMTKRCRQACSRLKCLREARPSLRSNSSILSKKLTTRQGRSEFSMLCSRLLAKIRLTSLIRPSEW